MSEPSPPEYDGHRAGVIERMAKLVTSMTVQNVLTLALLLVVAIPTFGMWEFLTNDKFRQEFLSTAKIIRDTDLPCFLVVGNISGFGDRTWLGATYEVARQYEHMLVIRSYRPTIPESEAKEICEMVHAEMALIKTALRERDTPSGSK